MEPVTGAPKQASRIVTDPKLAKAILEAISDEITRCILGSTIERGKPIEDISAENGIPSSTAYRRVHELAAMGLLVVERIMFTETGKRYSIYRNAFRNVKVEMESNELKVQVTLNEDVADRFYRIWQAVRLR